MLTSFRDQSNCRAAHEFLSLDSTNKFKEKSLKKWETLHIGCVCFNLKKIDFESKEFKDFLKNLKLFLFVYYRKNNFF